MEPPQSPVSLSLARSLFSSLPLSITSSPSLFLTTHPRPGEGADSSQRPSLSKRACYSAPSLWDRRKYTHAHTYTHTLLHESADAHTHRTCFHKGLVHNTHPRAQSFSLSHTHTRTNIVPMPMKYLHIEKLLTALRGCSACCQHFSKYADILHALIRIKCIIHTDTNLLSFRLFHSSADTNSTFFMASSCQSM